MRVMGNFKDESISCLALKDASSGGRDGRHMTGSGRKENLSIFLGRTKTMPKERRRERRREIECIRPGAGRRDRLIILFIDHGDIAITERTLFRLRS